jgi:pimeloyl-ACP methyl ester carboxylesterase
MCRTTRGLLCLIGFACISAAGLSLTSESQRGWLCFYTWRFFAGRSHGGDFVRVGAVSIYYETYGAGPPVLVMHGGLGTHEDMRNQIKALAASHFVIAPDSRGQGRSTDSNMQLTYSAMADDMVQLLDRLGISRVDVAGWSDGGIIGLELAMRHPKRVRRLVVISANFNPAGIRQSSLAQEDVPRTPIRYRIFSRTPEYWPIIYRKVMKMWRTQPNYSIEDLGRIEAPTLVIAGEFDIVRPEHTSQLAKAIPGSQEIIIKGSTHSVPTDKPDSINEIILRFLGNEERLQSYSQKDR